MVQDPFILQFLDDYDYTSCYEDKDAGGFWNCDKPVNGEVIQIDDCLRRINWVTKLDYHNFIVG